MPRLPLDTPVDDELRDVFAAASNNRQPPLNLATRAGFSVAQIDAIVQGEECGEEQPDALLAVARSAATSRGAVSEAPFDVPTAAEAA